MEMEQLVSTVEALIFVSGDPVPMKRLKDVLELEDNEIKEAIKQLSKRYQESGSALQVMEVAGGYQLRTRPTYSVFVNRFLERKKKTSLSGPALETLAIIAYKQPITRAEIEAIRGVGIDGVLKSLMDKRLVRVAGVKEVPGRPNVYGTTKRFLEYFGIVSLKDLPPIEDISDTFSSVEPKPENKQESQPETEQQNVEPNQNEEQEEDQKKNQTSNTSQEEASSTPNE